MIDYSVIPKSWKPLKLGEVCIVRNGYAFKSSDFTNSGVLLFRQTNLDGENVKLKNAVYLPEEYLEKYKDYKIIKGDVLVGMSGSIGKMCVYNLDKPALQNQRTGLLRFTDLVEKKFIRYYFEVLEQVFVKKSKGVAVLNISAKDIQESEFHLPSLPEQQAIVAKIEELLSELENGKQQLLTAQQQLKVYKQSLLKFTFEGKKLSPFEDFIDTSQNGLSKRTGTTGEEYKVLRLADITNNKIDNSSPRKIVMDENEIEKYKIKNDDLICIRVNGSKDLVGKLVHVATQNEKDNWAFCDHFIRFRLNPKKAFSKYFHYYFSTVIVRKYIHDNMVTSAGQNTVSQGIIKNVPVPVCSLKEQQQIVSELESKLTVCDKIEETISQSLQQAETLRQSILKQAFEGKLIK